MYMPHAQTQTHSHVHSFSHSHSNSRTHVQSPTYSHQHWPIWVGHIGLVLGPGDISFPVASGAHLLEELLGLADGEDVPIACSADGYHCPVHGEQVLLAEGQQQHAKRQREPLTVTTSVDCCL
jgi:hypothetical protein